MIYVSVSGRLFVLTVWKRQESSSLVFKLGVRVPRYFSSMKSQTIFDHRILITVYLDHCRVTR